MFALPVCKNQRKEVSFNKNKVAKISGRSDANEVFSCAYLLSLRSTTRTVQILPTQSGQHLSKLDN